MYFFLYSQCSLLSILVHLSKSPSFFFVSHNDDSSDKNDYDGRIEEREQEDEEESRTTTATAKKKTQRWDEEEWIKATSTTAVPNNKQTTNTIIQSLTSLISRLTEKLGNKLACNDKVCCRFSDVTQQLYREKPSGLLPCRHIKMEEAKVLKSASTWPINVNKTANLFST